jgi:hypothetical protein
MRLRIFAFLITLISQHATFLFAGDVFFQFNYDASFDTNSGANSAAAKSDFTYVANYPPLSRSFDLRYNLLMTRMLR